MKSLSRNFAIALFVAFVIGSIYGCAEKPITFAGPSVQIWKLNVVYDDGLCFKDQTLVLKPSETEKDIFHVTATIDTVGESNKWGEMSIDGKWKGEIRNGVMICNITSYVSVRQPSFGGSTVVGTAKGTFSKWRASGTVRTTGDGGTSYGKWTAERIS